MTEGGTDGRTELLQRGMDASHYLFCATLNELINALQTSLYHLLQVRHSTLQRKLTTQDISRVLFVFVCRGLGFVCFRALWVDTRHTKTKQKHATS